MPKHYDEVKEKTDEAVKNERVNSFKSKGFSESDAVKKVLTSMKREKSDSGAEVAKSTSSDSENYPYGLRLRLETDDLEKLSISDLPDVGRPVKIVAEAKVQSVSLNRSDGDEGENKCVELQITKMRMDVSKGDSNSDKDEADED